MEQPRPPSSLHLQQRQLRYRQTAWYVVKLYSQDDDSGSLRGVTRGQKRPLPPIRFALAGVAPRWQLKCKTIYPFLYKLDMQKTINLHLSSGNPTVLQQNNSKQSYVSTSATIMTAICSSCGGVGHSRSTNRNCPNNPRSHTVNVPTNRNVNTPASIAIVSSTSVTRRIPAARVVPFQESRPRGRNIYENGHHIFPAMDATCRHCKAKMWPHEKSSGTLNQPIFTLCCANGRVILPDIERFPARTRPRSVPIFTKA